MILTSIVFTTFLIKSTVVTKRRNNIYTTCAPANRTKLWVTSSVRTHPRKLPPVRHKLHCHAETKEENYVRVVKHDSRKV